MKKTFTRAELIEMVENVIHPDEKKTTAAKASQGLFRFCASCPDPLAAYDIVIETEEPLTAAEMVDLALACPYRDIRNVPETELPKENPLRNIRYGVSEEK